ncbi:lysine N(6)-hydroxylase/L-ornithine N(5)-oxygenase family protein [Thermostaphylospora chromogena]|uniref:L-lysine N6-monooxygenase MbtG n=1 Tax=Thermostaphylospora chromogena TaxID=35622 RepID=A0A1H1HPP1_9ACTN|nr:lysine N(6)-hydroxylase/L-ornithine N(5)-oxygenase family protein [Thermostaphylospora chromogena]SDR27352.1 L-ornithine N5-oxygenase [Thermostaphylospora chromogena]
MVNHTAGAPETGERILDLAGIGFGPSNLALAVALAERDADGRAPRDRLSAVFLEKQERFGWHRGMLIDGATMQVSFLKDLVTMRNPASRYSFVSYLHAKGRLADFINCKTLFPTRAEFHDYLEWVAADFADVVRYGAEVVTVRPVADDDGEIAFLDIVVQRGGTDGDLTAYRARNIVLAAGLRPALPPGVVTGERVWHSQELLPRLADLPEREPRRFVVVGAGQSAAEAAEYLHRRYPTAEVCAVFARYGYSPADDSPFANAIFDPAAVDAFYAAPREVKDMLLDYHANTNYSVVDVDLLHELYRRVYAEKTAGAPRLRVMNVSKVTDVDAGPSGVTVRVTSLATGRSETLAADAVVYCTGYRPVDPLDLLGAAGEYCLRDEDGRLRVDRDHRVLTSPGMRCGIYLQGATEHTHGITSTLLSTTAVRAGEIVRSLLDREPATTGESMR